MVRSGIGIAVVVALGLILGRTGVFRKVPPYVLDGIASVMVLGYGVYFLSLAVTQG